MSSSRLERPITDRKGDLVDRDEPPAYDGMYHESSGYGHARRGSGSMWTPEPYHEHHMNDGGMQNLMEPPDDRDVYPGAAPIGPNAAGSLGRKSQTVECPWCHAVITTRVKRRLGYKSGGAAVVVAIIAWPLFWVPLLIPGMHRKIHYCPQCRRKIGRGHRQNQP
ncbi:hypothetical protein GGF46_003524 [Coemansia sp. RSA 552]|nr:hypothetical protein GGF46_003524 [Coemansia sp. RSA 552]